MKKSIVSLVAGTAMLGLAACGSPAQPHTAPQSDPAAEQPTEDVPVDAEYSEVQDDDVQGARAIQDGMATFAYGDAATYPGGQGLKISYVEESKLSEWASADCSTGDPVSVYKITVKNDTGSRWEPWEDMMLAATYVDDANDEALEASDVFDDWDDKSLDGGQSLPAIMNGKAGSSYVGFCHPGGSADSVQVYGSFFDEYGDPAGDALWMTADSIQ